jgi:DNA-binding NarL/FixJ family response regulator
VVLAEDHPAMAGELHQLLASEYDIVAMVQDGAALVEAALRHVPDAIVCDLAMPRVSGLAAAVAILATTPDARIVFVTVQDSRAVVRKAFDLGARGYVLKCDAGRELVAAVREALAGGRYLSNTVRAVLDTPGRSTGVETGDVDD